MATSSKPPISAMPEAYRKKLKPRRSLPGSSQVSDLKKLTRWIRTQYPKKPFRYWKRTWKEQFALGITAAGKDAKEKPLKQARIDAHALLSDFDVAKLKDLSLETLVVAERMVWHMSVGHIDESLTPAIAEVRGLTDAVRVAFEAARHMVVTPGGYQNSGYVAPAPDGGNFRGYEPCNPLRHLLCAAPKADYEEARRLAETLRNKKNGTGLADRALLAYIFPDEPWATEDLLDALAQNNRDDRVDFLLSATSDADVVRKWVDAHATYGLSRYTINLACVLPPKDAVALFSEMITKLLVRPRYGPVHKTGPRLIAEGLCWVGTKEASLVLASYATNAILGPMVLAYFRDHPDRGEALALQAKGKGKLEATTARVLGIGKRDAKTTAAPLAKTSELPAIFRDAPWRVKAKNRKPAVVPIKSILGLELEKVRLLSESRNSLDEADDKIRDMTKTEVAEWKKRVEKDEYCHCDHDYQSSLKAGQGYVYLRVPDREGLWAWNEKNAYAQNDIDWVKKHGLAVIPGYVKRDWIRWLNSYDEGGELFDAVRGLVSPRVAPQIARVAARRKRFRRMATAWLLEHAEVSIYGLIPDALGTKTEQRSDAEAALLFIARAQPPQKNENEALVRKVAKKYGKEAERGIVELIERDPLATDVTVPKRPPFLRLEDLPQVKLAGGKKGLDAEALSALIEMLQIATIDEPYAGLALVREACDATSLGELAVELVEQWVIGDAPGRQEWMLASTIHLPSEQGTRRVAELAREWARKNQAKALRACTVLAADGSDLALMHLAHIAETTRFASLKKDTAALVQEAAGMRGLTPDELGDRTVPDAGLGPDGTIVLSYGARDFVVGLDPSLHPSVRERNKKGELLAPANTIPRPVKTDDAAKAKEARVRFDQLKKDLEAIAQRQVRRLERAMVLGRSWSVADFEARIAKHPLLRHIAGALVWETVVGKGEARGFRVAEDGSWADAADKTIDPKKLPGAATATIRIAHPARTTDLAKTWSTIFGDYAIVQPFEQLGRAVYEPTAAEKKAKDLARAAGLAVPARKLLGTMESRGWQRDDAGHVGAWLRPLSSRDGDVIDVRWPIRPGISMEDLRHAPDVTTEALVLVARSGAAGRDGGKKPAAPTLGMLDQVGFSEIVRDIEAVRNL